MDEKFTVIQKTWENKGDNFMVRLETIEDKSIKWLQTKGFNIKLNYPQNTWKMIP